MRYSKNHEALVNRAQEYGINLEELIDTYGFRFANKFFKHATEETLKNSDDIYTMPPSKVFVNSGPNVLDSYYKILKNSGFELFIKSEDLIDEDTGEVIEVEFTRLKPLIKK